MLCFDFLHSTEILMNIERRSKKKYLPATPFYQELCLLSVYGIRTDQVMLACHTGNFLALVRIYYLPFSQCFPVHCKGQLQTYEP